MPWIKLILETIDEHASELEDLLIELGAAAVTLTDNANQPLFEPPLGTTPLWSQTRIEGLFDSTLDMDVVSNILQHYFKEELPDQSLNYKIEALEDQEWEKVWMKDFKPMLFGKRLWICPSWSENPENNAINLSLDPGLAFGTGSHPTTAMCLEWLDSGPIEGKDVIDYGCGSGVLAIAAGLLGSRHVLAVDNDPQALLATRDNCTKNNLEHTIGTYSPEELQKLLNSKSSATPFNRANRYADVLIANILAGPLQNLANTLTNLVKPGGKIVLSGILIHQKEDVIAAYTSSCQLVQLREKEEWCLLELECNA